ncbi:MAG: hypothetical protein DDG60_04995 [Anaerolineae bacterium]|nr:MAG: hypothetical protein DDG60_04995 [Anaerolineae bacterium]
MLNNKPRDILIVGAGIAGLLAATDLQAAGFQPLIVDKGRGVGGRLATRRIGAASFDHGAQFITARTPRFAALLQSWRNQGLLTEWYRSPEDEHIRWRGVPTITALPKYLSQGLAVHLERKLIALQPENSAWRAHFEHGESISARAVLLTAPVPQSLAVLETGQVTLAPSIHTALQAIEYEPCLAVMAVLKGQSNLAAPGFVRPTDGNIAWLADNYIKGVSAVPAITLHATPAFSRAHWDDDRQETGKKLLQEATAWLGSEVAEFQVHGWRYARPINNDFPPALIVSQKPMLLLAGDAFGGARVEGAALSGWAAAELLGQHLTR